MGRAIKQVLLVEPEFYTRVQLDDDLAPFGFQVVSVKKIRNALIKVKTQIFQAILVSYDNDVETPLRLLIALRQNFNMVPVVILTRRPTESQLVRLMQHKPVGVVVKPYSLMDLVQRLDTMIEAMKTDKNA